MFSSIKNIIFNILLCILVFLLPNFCNSQEYADKDYYLIDSLEYSSLVDVEKKIIDSSLALFHQSNTDVQKLKAVDIIVENSWDRNVWPRYNEWMYDYTSSKLNGLYNDFNIETITPFEEQLLIYYAKSLNNKGYLLTDLGNIKASLEYYYSSLLIREKLNDSLGLSESYNNLGSIYAGQENYEKALFYMDKTLQFLKGLNNKEGEAVTLINKGMMLERLGDSNKALDCYNEALALSKKIKSNVNIVNALNNLGSYYLKLDKLDKSLEYFEEGLTIAKEMGYKSNYIISLVNISEIHFLKGNISGAKINALQAHELALKIKIPGNLISTSSMLVKIYKEENNWEDAFKMKELSVKMNDSIQNSEIEKSIIQQKAAYDLKKKEQEIELLSAKNEIQELKLTKNKTSIILISIALFLALIAVVVSIRGFKKKQYINKLLERQKAEISRKNEAKKAMLQEIHHRVKNNLQVVNSLLRMQSSKMEDEEVLSMFKETQSRVNSMAKLHEKMYESGDLKKINAKDHITKLIEEIVKNYAVGTKVELKLDIAPIFLDSQTMMPLGLIINEMITNSLKYAFKGKNEGLISVELSQKEKSKELIVKDDGVGFNFEGVKKGLGSKIIHSFVRQLNGSLEQISTKGTAYKIIFPN